MARGGKDRPAFAEFLNLRAAKRRRKKASLPVPAER